MYCNQCGNLIPQNGAFCTFCGAKADSPALVAAPPAPVPAAAAVPAEQVLPVTNNIPLTQNEKKEKPEKYYTTKHIVLCLVIAGVMAVAAGVFAGLYFSVI